MESEKIEIEKVLADTQPDRIGQWDECIWRLVCRLQAIPDLERARGQDLLPLVRYWWDLAVRVVGRKDWPETAKDFLVAWANYDPAREGLGTAVAEARTMPPLAVLADLDDDRLNLLANTLAVLQARAGDAPFFVAESAVAAHLDMAPSQAHRDLRTLVGLGLLKRLTVGGRPRGGKAMASTYLWKGPPAPQRDPPTDSGCHPATPVEKSCADVDNGQSVG